MLALHNTLFYIFYAERDAKEFVNERYDGELLELDHLLEMEKLDKELLHRRDYSLLPTDLKEYIEEVYEYFY
ncbi:hypothetical protein QA612_14180 [Evansella sp. AB-P1]|uniref:hypothetical protein n=1 Tax=Evansella sp. AB-P1 TaxID=3037653 RepID=UPI00241F72BB|nr:hypothetical protein [Evansella sp. AB-P1]MDG5788626.1 hypothetical protein [Evansella sp. AB-P1]